MLEFMLCSLVTILPDFLIRRYAQGKHWGREITFFTMWYELRWGITACAILTVSLITLVFYYHPSTKNVSSFFRTLTILPEGGGRVEEVFVENNQEVQAGEVLFRLDDVSQRSAVATAQSRVAEVDAAFIVAQAELDAAVGVVEQAQGGVDQASDELDLKTELRTRNPDVVASHEIERLENLLAGRQGALDAALASQAAAEAKIGTLLPAQKASAEAALEEAEVLLDKTVIRAGVTGRVEQFALKPGDYVNPILRPAGLLVPSDEDERGSGRNVMQAGFDQINAQVIKPGMIAEITCISKPFTIIPMVVVGIQDVIAAGQLRPTDQLVDIQERARPGTLTVIMEPLYEGQLDTVPPGSKCIANAYTSNHELLESGEVTGLRAVFLHVVDTTGLVHAAILRIQAMLLPVQTLVFSGH